MKKWLLHIWMISALCVLVASCVTDDDFAEYKNKNQGGHDADHTKTKSKTHFLYAPFEKRGLTLL